MCSPLAQVRSRQLLKKLRIQLVNINASSLMVMSSISLCKQLSQYPLAIISQSFVRESDCTMAIVIVYLNLVQFSGKVRTGEKDLPNKQLWIIPLGAEESSERRPYIVNECSTETTKEYMTYASLAALGVKVRELKLFEPIRQRVKIAQKTVKDTPIEKLYDGWIAMPARAHLSVEINSRMRADGALLAAFGRSRCAE